jgi:hypothetical protein
MGVPKLVLGPPLPGSGSLDEPLLGTLLMGHRFSGCSV